MDNRKIAFLTGTTGQDGSYLAELLLEKGYIVHGIKRRSSSLNTERIDHIFDKMILHYGDVTDPLVMSNLIAKIQPDEIYHLAAQSHVQVSFEEPYYTGQTDAIGTLNILDAVKNHSPHSKIYNACTSELYGKVQAIPQNEKTEFYPRSPYGVAKLYSFWIAKNYRESYGMFISNGILFNHGSPRRGETFIERKISIGLTDIHKGKKDCIYLGNIYSERDIGYAKEYVYGMWLMLQQDKPDDYVLATGETHTIKSMIEMSGSYLGMDIKWSGEGLEEVGIDDNTKKIVVRISEKYFRPAEVDLLIGDATKAKNELGWEPKIKLKELMGIMIENDMKNNNSI